MNFPEVIRDKCPCDDCHNFDLCKQEEVACRSFAKFVVDNCFYAESARIPTKETFNKVFSSKDDDMLRKFVRGLENEDKPEDNTGE